MSYRYRMFEEFFPENTVNRNYSGKGKRLRVRSDEFTVELTGYLV